MRLTEVTYEDARPVDAYGPGFFRIDGTVHRGPQLVTASDVTPWGGFEDAQTLLDMAGQCDVLFIGTGPSIAPLPAALRRELEAAGLGVEIMATDQACRTFNVLLSEGRRVAAALLPV